MHIYRLKKNLPLDKMENNNFFSKQNEDFDKPVIVRKNRSKSRTFSGSKPEKKRSNNSYLSNDGVVLDLEDCCQLTICDRVIKI